MADRGDDVSDAEMADRVEQIADSLEHGYNDYAVSVLRKAARSLRGGEVEREREAYERVLAERLCNCGPCCDTDADQHRADCSFVQALRSVDRALAAPDTEGREESDLPPPWGEGVKGPGMTEDDLMRMPGIARPEEAGGEDAECLVNGLLSAVEEAHGVSSTDWTDGVDEYYGKILDRLRGAPKGAGDTTPVKLHHSDVAAYILEGPDGPVSRDEALRSLHKLRELSLPARLRTGRKGRDDG